MKESGLLSQAIILLFALTIQINQQQISAAELPNVGGCDIFPADNWWNTPIDDLPVHARSNAWVTSIGMSTRLKADFGSGLWEGKPIGIPFVTVPQNQQKVPIRYIWYGDESDPGPFPIPNNAPIEGGGDRHVIVIQQETCMLYELYYSTKTPTGWDAGSGTKWDLKSNAFRPLGWTSADAAGLPIFPGLVRYDEIAAGEINHAIRFTAQVTQNKYDWPATHYASDNSDANVPRMGARFRLKANFDISNFSPEIQVILRALKKYGLVLADNGSNWYMNGVPDPRWDNDMLNSELREVIGANLEAVDVSGLMVSPSSGQVRNAAPTPPTTRRPTTKSPTLATKSPTIATKKPTSAVTTKAPTKTPTKKPTKAPTTKRPTKAPTRKPTKAPTTKRPTKTPTKFPTRKKRKNKKKRSLEQRFDEDDYEQY